MKRKIYNELLEWKQNQAGRTALLIDGARRVGKSYIARQFAENEYKSYIFIDFNIARDEVKSLFENYLDNLDTFFSYLSAFYNTSLYPGESIIVFDEVQMYPRARAAIKYLVADGRYHFLETGSLISIKLNTKDIVIPSEERHVRMYPMDFEEFLCAKGESLVWNMVADSFRRQRPLKELHKKVSGLMREYIIVGGMPQTVATYVETGDFLTTDLVKRDILRLYRDDIIKYASGYTAKVSSIFDAIPSQLQRPERKFRLADIQNGARFRQYEDAFFWLGDSMVVNMAYNTTAPNVGLRMNMERMTLKCYMADTGLLLSLAFDENELSSEQLYMKILSGKLEVNEGMIGENIVSQMLVAAGHKLFFYSKPSGNKEERMELDFLIRKPSVTSRHNIIPLEVKTSPRYTLTSLRKSLALFGQYLTQPTVIHPGDLKIEDGIRYLPYYMVPLL